MNPQRLDGKVIMITGASQGLGEGIARAAAAAGAAGLALTGRNRERGDRVAASIAAAGCPALYAAGDLADEQHCRGFVAQAEARFGRLDGLVNAAGLTDRGTIENTTVALWDLLFAVNVRAPFILMQELVRRLERDQRPGSIVNISTQSSHGGQPFLTAYSASKGALGVLTKNVAHSVRKHRIRVNALNIGWMDTPGEHAIKLREGQPPDWLNRAEAMQPFGRLLKVVDVATLTVLLLSDAGAMMTGSLIDFDQNVRGAYD